MLHTFSRSSGCYAPFPHGRRKMVGVLSDQLQMVRSMAWLYHNTKDAVNEFSKKYNCDLALAEEYLKVVRGIRNQQPFYVTDEDGEETGEDVALDDSWNYTDILWNGIQAEKVQRAFEKLNYREQTLLEKRLAICMTCGRVSSWKDRPTFEELAVMFEAVQPAVQNEPTESSGQVDGIVGCRGAQSMQSG